MSTNWGHVTRADVLRAIKAFACFSVKLLDGLPPRPRGGFTRAATLRPKRSLASACRMARSSELLVIWRERVE